MLVCLGKIYYELLAHRRANDIKDIAIVRLEQLYPFPAEAFGRGSTSTPNAKGSRGARKSPQPGRLVLAAFASPPGQRHRRQAQVPAGVRPAAASPAVGYYAKHNAQQKAVIETHLAKSKA